jgi:TolA-binding protein
MQEALKRGMEGLATVVGAHVEQLTEDVEELKQVSSVSTSSIADLRKEIDELKNQLGERVANTPLEGQADQIEELNTKFAQLETRLRGATVSTSAASSAGGSQAPDGWLIMGNLGWDLNAEQLLANAKTVLQEAEFAEFSMLSPMRTPGSTVISGSTIPMVSGSSSIR